MFNKTLKRTLLALLLIVVLPVSGCFNSSAACSYVKNCYFETPQSATFSDVNAMVSPYISEFNGYAYQIGKMLNEKVNSKKTFEKLLSIQQREVPRPDFTNFKTISMLYGDLLLAPQHDEFEKLPLSLRNYFEAVLCKGFRESFAKGLLPEENNFQRLILYEEMLARAGGAAFSKRDAYLVNAFKDDRYFKSGEIASSGIYILGAVNFLKRRDFTGAMMPLPFTTELIEKRSAQFINFKNKILNDDTTPADKKAVFLSVLAGAFLKSVRLDTLKEQARIEKFLKSATSKNGLFYAAHPDEEALLKSTYYAVSLCKLFTENGKPIAYPGKQALLQTLKGINKATSGMLVPLSSASFNPLDTYYALYTSTKSHCKVHFNENAVKKELLNYASAPQKHSFEENYCTLMSLKTLGYNGESSMKNYIASVKVFDKMDISEIYFFTLLAKALRYAVPQSTANDIKNAVYEKFKLAGSLTGSGEVEHTVEAYLSLSNIGADSERIKTALQNELKEKKYRDIRSLYYAYLFAQNTSDKNLIARCRSELSAFKTHYIGLYAVHPGEAPCLAATYYAYKIKGK